MLDPREESTNPAFLWKVLCTTPHAPLKLTGSAQASHLLLPLPQDGALRGTVHAGYLLDLARGPDLVSSSQNQSAQACG